MMLVSKIDDVICVWHRGKHGRAEVIGVPDLTKLNALDQGKKRCIYQTIHVGTGITKAGSFNVIS